MNILGGIFKSAGKIILFPILYFLLFSIQGVLGLFGFYLGKLFSLFLLPVTLINTYLFDVAPWVLISSTVFLFFFLFWWLIHLIRKIFF